MRAGAALRCALVPVLVLAALAAGGAAAAGFGTPGAAEPANLGAAMALLREDAHDLELLISFGTSKGGSAGHLALAIRDGAGDDGLVYSANFYADREPEHARAAYVDELMLRVPKAEYLYGTRSSLGDKASFGLDFGEVYKRSVVGVRVFGVPADQKRALAAFFARVNDDYRRRARYTDYHGAEVKYGYLSLNCAKTIGMAFKRGAGYDDLEVREVNLLLGSRVVGALTANVPSDMAMKLLRAWHERGYRMDVVLYRKFQGSSWIDPLDDEPVAFKDLPDRFPSVLSRDFLKEQGEYQDEDNLFAMQLLYQLARYGLRIDADSRLLRIAERRQPLPYAQAAALAASSARGEAQAFGRGQEPHERSRVIGQPMP
ncbi:MAG TPA: hypothetical protein PKB14_08835 [Rubrivivax sp.]|nr:hypothetical protein [Rubrivivax sp.]